jgi:hypothetical protein
LFGATSIVLANILGFLLLKEVLSPGAYIGVTLAVLDIKTSVFDRLLLRQGHTPFFNLLFLKKVEDL